MPAISTPRSWTSWLVVGNIIEQIERVTRRWALRALPVSAATGGRSLGCEPAAIWVQLTLFGGIEVQRLQQARQFAMRQFSPDAGLNSGNAERAESNASQPFYWNPDFVHHPAHKVVGPLVNHHLDHEAFRGLPENANLSGNNALAVDGHPIS